MQHEKSLTSPKNTHLIVFSILALYPLVGMGIDLIAPSLPTISINLKISHVIAKNLITLYLFGYALGNFFMGFFSDALGRRKFIIGGLLIFTLSSFLPIFFQSGAVLLLTRFLQGLAIAGFAVVSRAVLSDILTQKKLITTATLIATMWGIGPIIGPVIGAYLQHLINWEACFYFYAFYSLLGFIAMIFFLPETHLNPQELNFNKIKSDFHSIISDPAILGVAFLKGLTYAIIIAFNALGPFLIQSVLGFSPVYFGHIAFCLGIAFLIGTLICRSFLKHYFPEKVLFTSIFLFIVIALVGLIFSYIDSQNIGILIGISLFMFLGCGMIYPAALGKSLTLFRHIAGTRSAIINLINILIASLTGFLISYINIQSLIPIAWIYLTCIILCGMSYYLLVRKRN